MRGTFIVGGTLAAALAAWVGLSAQQEMLPKPGPGSGLTKAVQQGEWRVAIDNVPTVNIGNGVQLRGPLFLKHRAYKVTWPNGDEERVTIVTVPQARRLSDGSPEVVENGWVEVQSSGTRRWINIMAARSVEEAR